MTSQGAGQPRAGVVLKQAYLFVPGSVQLPASRPLPLLVFFHGARHDPLQFIKLLADEAERRGIVILAPVSRSQTWDVIQMIRSPTSAESRLSTISPFRRSNDARRAREAIQELSKTLPIAKDKIVIAGFSDGASFALAFGLDHDVDASAVLGFSPGLPIDVQRPARGRNVFIAHGRNDSVLPYSYSCGEVSGNVLAEGGRLTFRPFNGDHILSKEAVTEFLDATFGPVPGQPLHPIAQTDPQCGRIKSRPAERYEADRTANRGSTTR